MSHFTQPTHSCSDERAACKTVTVTGRLLFLWVFASTKGPAGTHIFWFAQQMILLMGTEPKGIPDCNTFPLYYRENQVIWESYGVFSILDKKSIYTPESQKIRVYLSMRMSQTRIAGWLWSQERTAGNNKQELLLTNDCLIIQFEKQQDVAGEEAIQNRAALLQDKRFFSFWSTTQHSTSAGMKPRSGHGL